MLAGDSRSFSCAKRYPRFVAASTTYPSARSTSTAFHTALRVTPSSSASHAPDTCRSRWSLQHPQYELFGSHRAPPSFVRFHPRSAVPSLST